MEEALELRMIIIMTKAFFIQRLREFTMNSLSSEVTSVAALEKLYKIL